MRLLIIRHAIAVPHGTPGVREDERPLTPQGERRFQQAAQGLARILEPPDALLTSPLPRARQTAQIAARAWNGPPPIDAPQLIDARPGAVARLLAARKGAKLVALVGHEPSLSQLVAHLLGASEAERFALRKGGAVLLELATGPRGGARLIWALPPRLLRKLAR